MHSQIAHLVLETDQDEFPIKAVIFDLDGTLIDTEPYHYQGWKYVLKNHGIEFTLEDYYPYIGHCALAIAEELARLLSKDVASQLLEEKRKFTKKLQEKGIPAIQQNTAFVHKIAAEKESYDIKLAVASAAKKTDITKHLKALGLIHYFDLLISGQNDLADYHDPEGTNKPKPYIYLETAKRLGIKPEECIVIEDSAPGVEAAIAAGCFVVAIPNAYTKHQDLSKAHRTIESLSQLSVDQFLNQEV